MKNIIKIFVATALLLIMAVPGFSQQKYLKLNKSREAVIIDRFKGDEKKYDDFASGVLIQRISEADTVTIPDILNLSGRDAEYNPQGDVNTRLWRLFDPCDGFTLSFQGARDLLQYRNVEMRGQDLLDDRDIKVFMPAEDCPPPVKEEEPEPEPKKEPCPECPPAKPCPPAEPCPDCPPAEPCKNDTIILHVGFYGQVGVAGIFGHGAGTSAEFGAISVNERWWFGVEVGVQNQDVKDLDYNVLYAAFKPKYNFFISNSKRTTIGAFAEVGYLGTKKEIIAGSLYWKGTNSSPYAGGGLQLTHLFGEKKQWGAFLTAGYTFTKLESNGEEVLRSINNDNGNISEGKPNITDLGAKVSIHNPKIMIGVHYQFGKDNNRKK